jgi:hypothetical protein
MITSDDIFRSMTEDARDKATELYEKYDAKKLITEKPKTWYCGVTGQEKVNDEFKLKRIKEHHYKDYPNLDIDSICWVKVRSVKTAMEVEQIMNKNHKFDIGKQQNEPTDENEIFVYVFRKEGN